MLKLDESQYSWELTYLDFKESVAFFHTAVVSMGVLAGDSDAPLVDMEPHNNWPAPMVRDFAVAAVKSDISRDRGCGQHRSVKKSLRVRSHRLVYFIMQIHTKIHMTLCKF